MRDLDFCIPAFNAQGTIFDCLNAIERAVPSELTYKIFVGDNESTDHTNHLAQSIPNVIVKEIKADAVATVRNELFKMTDAKVVVFLDADCEITGSWKQSIEAYLHDLDYITGSFVYSADRRSRREKIFVYENWFKYLDSRNSGNYINAGHMIIPSRIFESLRGFDEDLVTGEDYDLCNRAKDLGINVEPHQDLYVLHRGSPSTVPSFFKREVWHGIGDCQSVDTFCKSKVSLLSTIFVLSVVLSLVYIVKGHPLPMLLTASMPFAFSYFKFDSLTFSERLKNMYLCSVYLFARFCSVFFVNHGKWLYSKK